MAGARVGAALPPAELTSCWRLHPVSTGAAPAPRLLAEVSDGAINTRETRARLPRAQAQRIKEAASSGQAVVDPTGDGMVLQPLRVGQRTIGVFLLEGLGSRRSAAAAAGELAEVASLSGVALENALLHREVHERAERLADLERAK